MKRILALAVVVASVSSSAVAASIASARLDGSKSARIVAQIDEILVAKGASGPKKMCEAVVDLAKPLVKITGCDVEEIRFYGGGNAKLGNIVRYDDAGQETATFKAGETYPDVYFDFEPSSVVDVRAKFVFEAAKADSSNIGQVRCPEDSRKTIEDGTAVCLKNFVCAEGEYATDETTCAALPLHAARNAKTGWRCLPGYSAKTAEAGATVCKKNFDCADGEYAVSETECAALPAHAERNPKTGWTCVEGYKPSVAGGADGDSALSGDSAQAAASAGDTTCVRVPFSCASGRYAVDDSTCAPLPEHATRNEKDGFVCDAQYEKKAGKDGGGGRCAKIPYACANGEYALDVFRCAPLPDNTERLEKDGFRCKAGHVAREDLQDGCVSLAQCTDYEIRTESNTCEMIPDFAKKTSENFWECVPGYRRTENGEGKGGCRAESFFDFSLALSGAIGKGLNGSMEKTGTAYEIALGGEALYGAVRGDGREFYVGPTAALAYYGNKRVSGVAYSSVRLEVGFLGAIELGVPVLFAKPLISVALHSTAEYDKNLWVDAEFRPIAFGGEFGVRLGDSYGRRQAIDFFVRAMQDPLEDRDVEGILNVELGARVVLF